MRKKIKEIASFLKAFWSELKNEFRKMEPVKFGFSGRWRSETGIAWLPIAMIASSIISAAASRRGGRSGYQPSRSQIEANRLELMDLLHGRAGADFVPEFDKGFYERMGGGDMDWDSVVEAIARRKAIEDFTRMYQIDTGTYNQGAQINQGQPTASSAVGQFMGPFLQYMMSRNQPSTGGVPVAPASTEDYNLGAPIQNTYAPNSGQFNVNEYLWR